MVSQEPSNVQTEWLDGIFSEQSLLEEKTGGKRRTRPLSNLNRKGRQEILVLDPCDTEVLENKKDLLLQKIKYQFEDLVQFYIRECAYTPILYIFLMTLISDYLSGVLCFSISFIVSFLVVVLHYIYILLHPEEEDEEV